MSEILALTLTVTTDVAAIIQLAIAPVFLLAGIAGFLGVMSGRLGRVIDRARMVERRLARLDNCEQSVILSREHSILRRRATITNRAIGLCTAAGLMVCFLILGIFSAHYFSFEMGRSIVLFFAASMIFLMLSLALFLREVSLATRTLDIAREFGAD